MSAEKNKIDNYTWFHYHKIWRMHSTLPNDVFRFWLKKMYTKRVIIEMGY